jgi:hypothetical protein
VLHVSVKATAEADNVSVLSAMANLRPNGIVEGFGNAVSCAKSAACCARKARPGVGSKATTANSSVKGRVRLLLCTIVGSLCCLKVGKILKVVNYTNVKGT